MNELFDGSRICGSTHHASNVCEHGSLARSCAICQQDEEIAALKAEVARLTKERDDACDALQEVIAPEEVGGGAAAYWGGEAERLKAENARLLAIIDAAGDGVTARLDGKPITACPHEDPDVRDSWESGWTEQDEEMALKAQLEAIRNAECGKCGRALPPDGDCGVLLRRDR